MMYLDVKAPQILSMMDTLVEAVEHIRATSIESCGPMLGDMLLYITSITNYTDQIMYKITTPHKLDELQKNIKYSLNNMISLFNGGDFDGVRWRFDCEFTGLAFVWQQHLKFFLVDYVDKDSLSKSFAEEANYLRTLRWSEKVDPDLEFKYDVSIVVLFYNNAEMTKQCIDSIIKHSKGFSYELITINNGSDEATTIWSESLPHKKKVYYRHNMGPTLAAFNILDTATFTTEGRYTAYVSNDVIVTKDWLINLITCLESDPEIGMAVPLCNSLSNGQTIPVDYTNLDEMQSFAEGFNVSDPKKWQERARLFTFAAVLKSWVFGTVKAYTPYFCYDMFADDDMSVKFRRAGYKQMLCRDTFVHHYGSATIKENQFTVMDLASEQFYKKYSVDGWLSLSLDLFSFHFDNHLSPKKEVRILSVNPGFGESTMELRYKLGLMGCDKVHIDVLIEDMRYYEDALILSDSCASFVDRASILADNSYDFILFCGRIEEYSADFRTMLTMAKNYLVEDGVIFLSIKNPYYIGYVINLMALRPANWENHVKDPCVTRANNFISLEELQNELHFMGLGKFAVVKSDSKIQVENYIENVTKLFNVDNVNDYRERVSGHEYALAVRRENR